MRKSAENNNIFACVVKGTLWGIACGAVSFLISAAIGLSLPDPDKYSAPLALASLFISAFVGAFVSAKKCGSAIIRATADGVSAKCRITVKKPSLSLNRSSITLYPEESFILTARCSSNRPLTFRSSASAVASVDESGRIIARKKGTATITVKVDGVSRICKVTVKQPKSNSV